MNILMILTNGFYPDLRVYKEAKYLVSKGYKVEILCWDRDGRFINKKTEYLDNIKIVRFYEYSKYGSGLKQIFALLKFKNDCKKYLKNNNTKYDYIHCHDLDGMLIGYLLKIEGSKLIFDMHEFYETGSYAKIKFIIKQLVKYLQNKAYKIIHVNEQQTTIMSDKNKLKLIYLPNYPEKTKLENVKHIDSNKIRITYAGYVRHMLPMQNLIKTVSELDRTEVFIRGSGDLYNDLKKMEQEYKNITVTGDFKHEEIIKFYSNSDLIYVVYNRDNKNDETALPTKFFEAIICKIPMIVSKDSLMEEWVKKYDIGFSVDGTNCENIKELLQNIQNNKEILKEKRKNLEKLANNFLWEDVVKGLDKIYEQ